MEYAETGEVLYFSVLLYIGPRTLFPRGVVSPFVDILLLLHLEL